MFWNGKAGDHKKESATKIPGCYGSPDPEKMQHKANKGKRVGATVGTFAGAWIGSMLGLIGTTASESEPSKLQVSASVAIARQLPYSSTKLFVTRASPLSKSYPIRPVKRRRSPQTRKNVQTRQLWEKRHPSLFEKSSSERLRQQARRALMRQGLPLDLSSLPVHGAQTSID